MTNENNPPTTFTELTVTYSNGQTVSFKDAAGLSLSKVKAVESIIKEEVKATQPPRTSRTVKAA